MYRCGCVVTQASACAIINFLIDFFFLLVVALFLLSFAVFPLRFASETTLLCVREIRRNIKELLKHNFNVPDSMDILCYSVIQFIGPRCRMFFYFLLLFVHRCVCRSRFALSSFQPILLADRNRFSWQTGNKKANTHFSSKARRARMRLSRSKCV